MTLSITITGNGFMRLNEAVRILGERRAHTAYNRAINRAGDMAGTAAGRALSKQTGLPAKTTRKAVKQRVTRSTPATLTYIVHGSGGNISLRHFSPNETRKGVTARPWGKRQLYQSSFMKAGFWPSRVDKPGWNRQVFRRTGGTTGTGMDEFEKVKSDLYIPTEMTKGATAQAWAQGTRNLQQRIAHEIKQATKGAVT